MPVADLHLQPLGQGVDDRSAYAVQSAGHLVSAAAKFAAGVQHGKDNRHRRDAQLWLDANRDAAAVILDAHNVPRQQVDQDLGAVPGHNLVDGVVHNLIDQVMKTLRPGGADVHARALAHRVQPLQDLNITGIILFGHCRIFFRCIFQSDSLHHFIVSKPLFARRFSLSFSAPVPLRENGEKSAAKQGFFFSEYLFIIP